MIRLPLLSLAFACSLSIACATVTDEAVEDLGSDTGGTAMTGGAASGGSSSGGTASGGTTTTGGSSSGGVFGVTGGTGSGGVATGGSGTGGAGTGGAGTGGSATGGAGTGGGLNCAGAVEWVAGQTSVNYQPGQLFKYMGKIYSYDGTAAMTYVHEGCPPDQSGETWCQSGQYPYSEKTSC